MNEATDFLNKDQFILSNKLGTIQMENDDIADTIYLNLTKYPTQSMIFLYFMLFLEFLYIPKYLHTYDKLVYTTKNLVKRR